MNETISSEGHLFRAYEVVFQALLNGLIVAVVVMGIAAIVLTVLCCLELRRTTRRRDAELAEACEEGMKNSFMDASQKQRTSPLVERTANSGGRFSKAAEGSVEKSSHDDPHPACRNSRFRSFSLKLQKQRSPQ